MSWRLEIWRPLRRRPWFALAVLACFTFGIGLNAVVLSAVRALLIKPLPFADPDQLVHIQLQRAGEAGPLSWREARELGERVPAFAEVAAYTSNAAYNFSGVGPPEELPATIATHNLFAVLDVPLQHGRTWPAQFDRERNFGIVLSHELYERRFGGDPDRLQAMVTLDGHPGYQVFGVAPAGFDFPVRRALFRSSGIVPDWIENLDARSVYAVARLRAGTTMQTAQQQVDRAAADLAALSPNTNRGIGFEVRPLRALYAGGVATHLELLLLAGVLLLVVACANIANLFLARALEDDRDVAVSRALGASAWRLLKPMWQRAAVLAGLGSGLGLAVAWWTTPLLWQGLGATLPVWMSIQLDPWVAGVMVLVAVLCAALTSLWPARQLMRRDLRGVMARESRGSSGDRGSRRFQWTVLLVQLGLTALLVGGALALAVAFGRLQRDDVGIATTSRETARVALPWSKYSADDGTITAFYRGLEAAAQALPGAPEVAWSTYLPLALRRGAAGGAIDAQTEITIEGQGVVEQQGNPLLLEESVSPNYFSLLDIRRDQGRGFEAADHVSAPRVGLLNRAAAQRLWPGQSAVGKRLKVGRLDSTAAWLTIVGVVEDVRHDAGVPEPALVLYTSTEQLPQSNLFLVFRSAGGPVGPAGIAQAVQQVDPDQSIYDYAAMDALRSGQLWQQQLTSRLFVLFAGCAMALALVGTYGLVMLWAAQRERELGVRVALGATARQLRQQSMRDALWCCGCAALLALPLAMFLIAKGQALFALDAADGLLVLGGALAALCAAGAMMLIPAWRASRNPQLSQLLRP